jgi:murein L,D-transpeptidase YafK
MSYPASLKSSLYRRFVLGLGLAAALPIALVGCGGQPPERPTAYVDSIVVKKSQRKLQLISAGKVVREYHIALGDAPVGQKMREGDERTPEGNYIIDWRNPNSNYHKALHISYPNEQDREVAQALGVDPGGMIMVHGLPGYISSPAIRAEYARRDWTNGCIAVQDHEIDEIWRLVRDGTPIRILP